MQGQGRVVAGVFLPTHQTFMRRGHPSDLSRVAMSRASSDLRPPAGHPGFLHLPGRRYCVRDSYVN